jgi:formylmethanofuran dehydrogenase subunit E
MKYPEFFDDVPKIKLCDPLAEFLGALDDGIIEYSYFDAVKLAGHSCPTVASAYWMTCKALKALYGENMPERGNIRIEFRQGSTDGVCGVIANVAGFLTGAGTNAAFKGIGGRFDRRNRLLFGSAIPCEIRFTRLDTGQAVNVSVNLQAVPSVPRVSELLAACLNGTATPDERAEFGQAWQTRVKAVLLDHADDMHVFKISME